MSNLNKEEELNEFDYLAMLPLEINIMKGVEELNELQRELIMYITKGKDNKFNIENVKSEMADVFISMMVIKMQLDISDVELSLEVDKKLKKTYIDSKNMVFGKI